MFNQNNGYGSYKKSDPYDNFVTYGQRPVSITVVCVAITLLLVLNMVNLISLTSDPNLNIPAWVWALTITQFALVIASIIGLWNMWKWGAFTYSISFGITVIGLIFSFNVITLIVSVILLVFIYRKFNEMS